MGGGQNLWREILSSFGIAQDSRMTRSLCEVLSVAGATSRMTRFGFRMTERGLGSLAEEG